MAEDAGRRRMQQLEDEHLKAAAAEEEGGGKQKSKRGRVELRRIEDRTSRQVCFSNRQSGLFKKAFELSVLCHAEVALVVFSPAGRLYEFVSSDTSIEEIFGRCRYIFNTLDLNEQPVPDSVSELNNFAQMALELDFKEMSMAELTRFEEIVTDALTVIKSKLIMKMAELAQTEAKLKTNPQKKGNNWWSTGYCLQQPTWFTDCLLSYRFFFSIYEAAGGLLFIAIKKGHLKHVGVFLTKQQELCYLLP